MNKTFQDKIEYAVFQLLLNGFSFLPYNTTRKITESLALFVGDTLGVRKKVAMYQLRTILTDKSEAEIRQIFRQMWRKYGTFIAETYFGDNTELLSRCTLIGGEYAEEALSRGKGFIFSSAHLGNFELASRFLASQFPVAAVVINQRNPYFNEYIVRFCKQHNMVVIFKKRALKGIIEHLRKNYCVILQHDQHAGKRNGIKTTFMGHTAWTAAGPARISQKIGCPVLPGCIVRTPENRHNLILTKPIEPSTYTKDNEGLLSMTQDITDRLAEEFILKYPDQWFWVHRRWRD
ncbi:MAG: lysophospholipid acyltransferase family protein [Candidatus Cloacimonetes bacterium]|nr:lysophospholipid acyltransferase family protein [Candidatus Cloacimonadota bacterium]